MPTVTICDLEEDKCRYNLDIRVRIISVFDEPEWNKRMGKLHGPLNADPTFFMIDLDPDEYDMDGVSDRVKVMGKNFEIVGKHEQRKALLTLLENDELRFEVLKTMVKAGCSITERYPDLDNGSALFFTAFSGIKEACNVLLKLGADPNVVNDNGWTAVMIAASQGKSNAMRILIEGGADMEMKNDSGWTALLVAANAGKKKCVKMLLLMGANTQAKNNYGKNAFDLANDSEHQEVMEILLSNGIGPSEDAVVAGDARKFLPSLTGVTGGEMKGPRRSRRVGRRRSFAGTSSAVPLYMQDEESNEQSDQSTSKNVAHTPSPNKSSILPPLSNSPSDTSSIVSSSPAATSPAPTFYVDPKQLQLALQNGWSKSIDEVSGCEYFYHIDGRSSWTVPVNDGTWILPGTDNEPAPYNPDEDVYKGAKDSVTGETFRTLALSKKKKDEERRAPESRKTIEIRQRREREGSLRHQRQTREIERLAFMEHGQRHKKKAIDKDKYLGNYTKDKTRRRSF